MIRKKRALRYMAILILIIGLAILLFWLKTAWKYWDENAFNIVTELVLPAGKLYYPKENKDENSFSQNKYNLYIEAPTGLRKFVPKRDKYKLPVDNTIPVFIGNNNINELTDYNMVLKKHYVVSSATTLKEEVLQLDKLIAMDLRIKKESQKPQILIFHTHGQEWFADTEENGKTIVDAGKYLTELLQNEYGYNVIHLTESFDLVDGVLDRSTAYTYANERLEEVLKENPSIEVVIDLHRDGVSEDRHLVTEINGKKTAQLMFFNGISYTNGQGELEHLKNPYLTENLAMSYQMFLLGEKMYPGLLRCIYIEGYRYCLHHRARSMLVEAGAQTNTYEEIHNAMEPLAKLLATELGG